VTFKLGMCLISTSVPSNYLTVSTASYHEEVETIYLSNSPPQVRPQVLLRSRNVLSTKPLGLQAIVETILGIRYYQRESPRSSRRDRRREDRERPYAARARRPRLCGNIAEEEEDDEALTTEVEFGNAERDGPFADPPTPGEPIWRASKEGIAGVVHAVYHDCSVCDLLHGPAWDDEGAEGFWEWCHITCWIHGLPDGE
jgi:hypothetical protein